MCIIWDKATQSGMADSGPGNVPEMVDSGPGNLPEMADSGPGNSPEMADFGPGFGQSALENLYGVDAHANISALLLLCCLAMW